MSGSGDDLESALACLRSHEPDVRIIGNVRASTLIQLLERTAADKAVLDAINVPETADFDRGVPLEAVHQQQRWGSEHDAGKAPEDWFWLIGYLAGKALHSAKSGETAKALHHCISTAAALRNWHRHIQKPGAMRPGILPPQELARREAAK